jgi:hypothetical protein
MHCTQESEAILCTEGPAVSKSFAAISPRNLFEDSSWRREGWREADGYCSLPSEVYRILQADILEADKKKPYTSKWGKQR